jgi:3-(3-hydroxy-phenyl)propionate hydroxylase
MPKRYDVVICGYGPTGAVAANLLGALGVSVLVVERSPEIHDIPRAVHFDGEVMRIFQQLGLAEEAAAVSGGGDGLTVVNGSGRVLLSTRFRDHAVRHAWPAVNLFNQPLLEEKLRRGVQRYPSVEVRLGWEVVAFEQDADGVRVRIRENDGAGPDRSDADDEAAIEIAAGYLLGCDGASSTVRRLAGIALEDLHCHQPWLVCDVMLDEDVAFERTVYLICDRRRPATLAPCEGRHIRWEFMLQPGDDPAELEEEEHVRALMAPHLHRLSPDLRPEQGTLLRKKVYTFHGLIAERWRSGRVFLLGDAAHQTPPFLGQGMCAGVRDAFNLCWKLEAVLADRFREELLATYESERAPHARAVIGQAIRVGHAVQTTHRFRAFLRDALFTVARWFPPLLRNYPVEPVWPLGAGFFAPTKPPGDHTPHGYLMDQSFVETAAGERVRLDEVLGGGFAVLAWERDPQDLLDGSARETLAALGARLVRVLPPGTPTGAPETVTDVEGGVAGWLRRVGGGSAVVLRPDRQVFALCTRRRRADLRAELNEALTRLAAGLTKPTAGSAAGGSPAS